MEYRDILAFMGVARSGSFSGAADSLHLAQSAVSRRVVRLEQALGVALLTRHPRGAKLTPAGAVLAEKFRDIESQYNALEAQLQALGAGNPSELVLAMPRGAVRAFSAQMVTQFRQIFPNVRLQIFERESAQNQASVLRGEADLALVYGAEPHPDLVAVPLLTEQILVVGPLAEKGSRTRDPISIEALAALPLILPGKPHGYRRVVESRLGEEGLAPNVILEVNGFATSLNMVQQGLGFAISTYAPIVERLEAGLLSATPIAGRDWQVDLFLVRRRDARLSAALRGLLGVLEDTAASQGASEFSKPVRNVPLI